MCEQFALYLEPDLCGNFEVDINIWEFKKADKAYTSLPMLVKL